nr:unnamed protein product [Digitaria exilis]
MLTGAYLAVVQMAVHHMLLFLPRAPLAAWEAMWHVGFEKIGVAVSVTSGLDLLLDYCGARWLLVIWCCLVVALIAAVLAFWICLARTYGHDEPGRCGCWGGLAIALPLSSLLAAALTAAFIYLVSYGDQC